MGGTGARWLRGSTVCFLPLKAASRGGEDDDDVEEGPSMSAPPDPSHPHSSQCPAEQQLVSSLENVCLTLRCHFQTSLSSFNLAGNLNTHFN